MKEVKIVDFHGQPLWAVEDDGLVLVAVKPICENIGVNWNKQLERIKRDAILSQGMTIMVIPSTGGPQETVCLSLELVHGWLFGIDDSRIRDPQKREAVLRYKRECYAVLFEHFFGKATAALREDPEANPSESVKLRMVTEARLSFGTKAAQQTWFDRGLPTVAAMHEASHADLFSAASRLEAGEATH